jgi:hypothetical protein
MHAFAEWRGFWTDIVGDSKSQTLSRVRPEMTRPLSTAKPQDAFGRSERSALI